MCPVLPSLHTIVPSFPVLYPISKQDEGKRRSIKRTFSNTLFTMNTPSNQKTGKWKQRAQKQIYSGSWPFKWRKSYSPIHRRQKSRGLVKTQTGDHSQGRMDDTSYSRQRHDALQYQMAFAKGRKRRERTNSEKFKLCKWSRVHICIHVG